MVLVKKFSFFSKGLVHDLNYFQNKTSSLYHIRRTYTKCKNKNVLEVLKSSKHIALFEPRQSIKFSRKAHMVSPWFWSKICIFFILCFLDQIGPKKVFYDVLGRKFAFLDDQNVELKKGKICIFGKVLVHGFGQKLEFFSILCLLDQIGLLKVFHNVLDRI